MKKGILFIVIFTAIQSGLLAQSFSIPSSTYSFWGYPTNNLASVAIPVTNLTNGNIYLVTEKIQNNLASIHSSLFCFGSMCYDTSTTSSLVTSFGPNATLILLADLFTNGAIGESCVTYRIKNLYNTSEFIDVEICFHINNTATGMIAPDQASILSIPQPNPADRFTAINYNLADNFKKYTVAVYNTLGSQVKQINFSEKTGNLILETDVLTPGVYFYSLMSGNKVWCTNKLVVVHKN